MPESIRAAAPSRRLRPAQQVPACGETTTLTWTPSGPARLRISTIRAFSASGVRVNISEPAEAVISAVTQHGANHRDEAMGVAADRGCYSAIISPEPPNSLGKSLSFGSPSLIGSTDS